MESKDTSTQDSAAPIKMILHCPQCHTQHIDAPEYEGANHDDGSASMWDNPPHRSHLCHHCSHIWRPADVPTEGVRVIETCGKADSPVASQPHQAAPEATSDLCFGPNDPPLAYTPLPPLEWEEEAGEHAEALAGNIGLVIARLEQIKHISGGMDARGLAIEALVCAKQIEEAGEQMGGAQVASADAWMRSNSKECISAEYKEWMENAGFGVWDKAAQSYTIPLYFAAPTTESAAALDVNDLDFEPDAHHTVADMANVGYSLMQAIKAHRPDYSWCNCPAEIVGDLCNELDEAKAESAAAPADLSKLTRQDHRDALMVPDSTGDYFLVSDVRDLLAKNRAAERDATERKPLTDAEIFELAENDGHGLIGMTLRFARRIEQHHGITGGGK